MPYIEFGCLPTIIGSMPHTDPAKACSQITRYLKDIPAWPQLPNRSFLENMYVQFSEGFPGVELKEDSIYIDRSQDLDKPLEQLYAAYLEENIDKYPVSPNYAAGFHSFLSWKDLSPLAVKGQITGPVTWGLTVTDENGKAIIYDDVLGDVVPKLLRLKASWQEKALSQVSADTIIFVDEPYLVSLGSVFTPIPEEKVPALLEEVIKGIKGVKGLHCCGNTNWSVLLDTKIDILSFDAYNYASSLGTYSDKVESFLERGGNIAWGIVPNDEDALAKESLSSLRDRLEEAMAQFTRDGVKFRQLIAQGLITPSCGLDGLSPEAASQALELTAKLSRDLRSRYAA